MARGPAGGRGHQKTHGWAQSCNVGWQQTVFETRQLSRDHHKLQHLATDPIHPESQVQMEPTSRDPESRAGLAEEWNYCYYYYFCTLGSTDPED